MSATHIYSVIKQDISCRSSSIILAKWLQQKWIVRDEVKIQQQFLESYLTLSQLLLHFSDNVMVNANVFNYN